MNFNLKVNELRGDFPKAIGLMFQSYQKARISSFPFNPPQKISLTMLFCFFPILVLYLKNRELVDFKVLNPFIFNAPAKEKADNIVEIPLKNEEFNKLKQINNISPMIKILSNLDKVKSSTETKALNTS